MHSPTVAVFSQIIRHRWLLLATVPYIGAALILHFVLPKSAVLGVIQFAILGPLVVGLIPLFAYAIDADLAGRDSIFPARLFTLPLTTRALVGWPMLYGTVAIAITWLAVSSFVIRPAGMYVPLWWPAVLLAGCLAWLQAVAWRPFGLPWLRLLAGIMSIGVLVAVSALRWGVHLPEVVVSLLLGSTIPPAYLAAVTGVARARRGDQAGCQWLAARARDLVGRVSRPGRPLSSPSEAQVWFEWQRSGLACPILAGLMILLLAAWIAINRQNPGLSPNHLLRSPILMLVIPLVATVSTGSIWGRYENPRGGSSLPSFLATRPITCAGLISAKMKAAALSAVVVWGMTLLAFVLMVLLTGSWAELASQWNVLTKGLSAAKKVVLVALGSVLLLATTWRLMIINLYLGLAGRAWIWAVGMVVIGPALVATVPLGFWLTKQHPEYSVELLAMVPWALGSAAVLKLLVGGWLVRVIVRRRLVPLRFTARLSGAWLLTTAGLTGLLCWLVPDSLVPWYLVTASVVLAMPLVRISITPLALAWNRHR